MRSRAVLAFALVGLSACSSSGGKTRAIGGGNQMGGDPSTATGDDAGTGAGPGQPGGNAGGGGVDSGGGPVKPDDGVCEELFVTAEPTIPEMLIVLDNSGSMLWVGCDKADLLTRIRIGCPDPAPPYDQPFDRWAPSVDAIKTLTASLQDKVSFGLLVFPGEGAGSAPVCSVGDVLVEPALGTSAAIGSALDGISPEGATPTPGALKKALDFLGTGLAGPDEKVAPKYVLLITDGAPSCTAGGTQDNTGAQATPDSYAAIDALATEKIQTYVIGYDTIGQPALGMVLDEMAVRGKTGDTKYRPVDDGQSLLNEFTSITGQIASCTYSLDKKPDDPKYIRVTLDGNDIALGDEGWVLANDTTIELRGAACALLQDGAKDHALSIKVECAPVIVQ